VTRRRREHVGFLKVAAGAAIVTALPLSHARTAAPLVTETLASVAGAGAALAGVSLVAALAFFVYTRRFRGTDDATAALSRVRRAFRVGLPVVYVAALVAMLAVGWPEPVETAVGSLPGGESAVGSAVSLVAALAVPGVAVVAGYFGAFPVVRDLRDVDVSAATVAVRVARYAVGLAAVLTLVVAALVLAGDSLTTGAGFALVVAVLVVLAWAGSPVLVRLVQSTRAPTDAERDRLDRLCGDAGLDPHSVRVLDVADAKQAFAFVRGLPRRRHLFVSDYLLAELDDDHLRGYLALRAGRARRFHLEARLAVVVGTLTLAFALLFDVFSVPGVDDWTTLVVVLLAGTAALWLGRRLVYRADADAAARTSRETVEAVLRRDAELNDAPLEWGRLTALRRMEPPLARRIDRLRDRASRE